MPKKGGGRKGKATATIRGVSSEEPSTAYEKSPGAAKKCNEAVRAVIAGGLEQEKWEMAGQCTSRGTEKPSLNGLEEAGPNLSSDLGAAPPSERKLGPIKESRGVWEEQTKQNPKQRRGGTDHAELGKTKVHNNYTCLETRPIWDKKKVLLSFL